MTNTVVEVKDFRKAYGEYLAMDNISFAAKQGESFGLLGSNGVGNTHTLECLDVGTDNPTVFYHRNFCTGVSL